MLREPLLHFLVAGFLLYVAVDFFSEDNDPYLIRVTPENLATFVQYRSQSFGPDSAQRIDNMSEAELDLVLQQYIEEEVLYREAIARGMDADDYVIRRRLVQKMEFLTESQTDEPTKEVLREFYDNRQSLFKSPDKMTFTHIFLSQDLRGDQAHQAAESLLSELERNKIEFNQATGYGDQFPYNTNYVERSEQEVGAHFGSAFADTLFSQAGFTNAGDSIEASDQPINQWLGPIKSSFGSHLVLVRSRIPGTVESFEQSLPAISAAYRAEQQSQKRRETIAKLKDQYVINLSAELKD